MGWAISPEGPSVYMPGGIYHINRDVNFYAVWEKTHTVKIDAPPGITSGKYYSIQSMKYENRYLIADNSNKIITQQNKSDSNNNHVWKIETAYYEIIDRNKNLYQPYYRIINMTDGEDKGRILAVSDGKELKWTATAANDSSQHWFIAKPTADYYWLANRKYYDRSPAANSYYLAINDNNTPYLSTLKSLGYVADYSLWSLHETLVGVTNGIDNMLDKFENDATYLIKHSDLVDKTKKATMVMIGHELAKYGYEPAFIAGLMSNIHHEGNIGQFERDWGGSVQSYLRLIPNYLNEYSNKNITDKNLTAVKNLLLDLKNKSSTWQQGKFGLGTVQWTEDRTLTLLDIYLEVTNNKDSITYDQAVKAEGMLIDRELTGYYNAAYKNIYQNWLTDNNANTNSENAAYTAGYELCVNYESPSDRVNKAVARGNVAKDIYKIMNGGSV
ncbi:MAG: phage tail tip lysozyme [Oscillospiraceae bacterium]|nr:phage tail tip lysozyme [Oscillospiraceae bacterium]